MTLLVHVYLFSKDLVVFSKLRKVVRHLSRPTAWDICPKSLKTFYRYMIRLVIGIQRLKIFSKATYNIKIVIKVTVKL